MVELCMRMNSFFRKASASFQQSLFENIVVLFHVVFGNPERLGFGMQGKAHGLTGSEVRRLT